MQELESPLRTYTATGRSWTGDYADVWEATTDDGGKAIVKVAHGHAADQLAEEALYVARLRGEVEDKFLPYLPHLLETFPHDDTWVNTFEALEGFYTLAEIREAYPTGVDPKDLAWMARRLLTAISIPWRVGLQHHQVLPEHVMILPDEHGMVLIDWCLAGDRNEDGQVYLPPRGHMDFHVNTANVDLSMAAQCLAYVAGGEPGRPITVPDSVPRPIRTWLIACADTETPVDPVDVLAKFDELIERLWGRRRWHPFTMPSVPATK